MGEKLKLKLAINAWYWPSISLGLGQYLRNLLPALLEADDRLELHLVSPIPFEAPLTEPANLVQSLYYHVAPTPFSPQTTHLARLWFEQITFPQACQKLDADLVHVPYYGLPLYLPLPTVVTIPDLIPLMLKAYRRNLPLRLYILFVALAAPRAKIILTLSEASKRDILSHLKVSQEQVRVTYLAPAPHFQPVRDSQRLNALKQKYRLPENFVLYLGGYAVHKNIGALLQAFKQVKPILGQQVGLVLAGALPGKASRLYPDPLQLAERMGLELDIVTPGRIAAADLPALYSAAAVFVYPSAYEGFGFPVLEAMACGTPVVTTNAASIPELAGSAAFQLDPTDSDAIAASIICLCTDKAAREEMVERGYTQVKKFTWRSAALKTLQAYQAAYGLP
jgi:glycosyltransferase involved in cell wall biosynthesis